MDRLGRPLRNLVHLVALFHEQEVTFVRLCDNISTITANGRFK
ncbi:recombinase family protein [Pedobacter sp. UYP24]